MEPTRLKDEPVDLARRTGSVRAAIGFSTVRRRVSFSNVEAASQVPTLSGTVIGLLHCLGFLMIGMV